MTFNNATSGEECHPRKLPKVQPGDEVVISGISGRFPESNNVKHLQENLLSKRDLITDDGRRWKLDHPDIPQRTGKVYNVDKFDALFFGVHFKQAHTMDPMCRMLLEHAYEAVIDAGVNPKQIRGSRTGVFMGACFSESEKTWFYDKLQVNGFGITGCARSMLANRISYFLGIHGPSYTLDTACSSSLYAMEHAYRAIQDGLCDAAIVGTANLCLHPYVSMQFFKLGVLSSDGRCKVFDESANGYVRSEAISVAFLQKSKDAKRIYATVVHGKTNCDGFKEQGVTFPSSRLQSLLLEECYLECGIPPTAVSYVEAHGTGTRVGDPEEVNAIDLVMCKDRKTPLLVGSVKSNLGHAEPASGLCAIAKVITAMESGIIPPNLHFNEPRKGVAALEDGRIKVVSEPTPWEGGYAGINSFGFGGANAHILLKSNEKTKVNNGLPNDSLPRMVPISGRTEDSVATILNDLNSRPVDAEYVALLHNIHSDDINGHLYRGYTILPPSGVASEPVKDIKSYPGVKRPIWFVFSGMGSQWPGMGEALLRIPVFAAAIKRCDAVLRPRGIDIFHVITNKEKSAFDNILNSFVGIAAVQIGLVDVLRSLGIEPDNIIGHSVGELGCGYADGCFTAEQMILSAYSRGLASIETKVIYGSMAAVGMGYKELKNLCPPDIEVACHNSVDSATISGPAESMKAFVADLTAKKIFAREVPCSNIPYHSRYIAPAGPKLLAYLQKVIPDPKPRSSKWLSSSVSMDKWDTPLAQFSSAEYHTNNLLSPVLFEESSALIPKDAITIEIAPHGLLQAIIRRSLPPSVTNIALTQRGHVDNAEFLLNALGKLFVVGLNPQMANLYPPVEFPVSRSTPMISPLIKWEHSDEWYVTSYKSQMKIVSGERIVKVDLADSDYESMAGHVIDGRNLFPATGYLTLVWETIGLMHGELYFELSVVFEDVKFLRATNIPKEGSIEFTVTIQKGSGRFEIVEGGVAVVQGFVRICLNPSEEKINPPTSEDREEESMSSRDVYKELALRGYHYTGVYRSIKRATINGSRGHIGWSSDWIAFMDNMLQMQILGVDTRGLFVPTRIKKLVIDTKAHLSQIKFGEIGKEFPVYVNKLYETISCGGVEVRGLKASAITRKKPSGEPVLEEYRFVPYQDKVETSLPEIAKLVAEISLENQLGIKVKTIEFIEEADEVPINGLLSPLLSASFGDEPLVQADINIVCENVKLKDTSDLPANVVVADLKKVNSDANALLVVGHRLLSKSREANLNLLLSALKGDGFLLTREVISELGNIEKTVQEKRLHIILEKKYKNEAFILLRKIESLPKNISVIFVKNDSFNWVEDMRKVMSEELEKETSEPTRILFVGQGEFENGLMGFINCLRKEPGGEVVRGLLIQDSAAPEFSLNNPLYAKQLQKDLAVCVLRENKTWGGYRHLSLPPPELKLVRYAWVNQLVTGDLSSFAWLEGPIQISSDNKNIVNIVYSSVNFKDIMFATGKLAVESATNNKFQQECLLGFEYCGIDSSGKRVMGIAENRCLANFVNSDPYLTWEIPSNWSLEDAATVPCVYGTCYFALYKSGKMKRGDKVLIHAGTGGVGQAAIYLALHEGCEVFTTVGTPEKRRFIRKQFPQIPEDHIGNSRDTSFEKMILEQTNGRGVDIVLNSLAGDKLLTSVNCLAWGGRFLEIGKFDLTANNPLGMECFLREVSFHGIMINNTIEGSPEEKKNLHKYLYEGMRSGAIKPLIRTVFTKDQVEAAFRYMAAGKHMGKVIIKIRDDKESLTAPTLALPRYHCQQNRSYIILGGLGGFGLELAEWLIMRGAKNIVLTSRNGVKNGYQKMHINLWKSYGVKVVIIAGKDAARREDCQEILETAAKIAPVDGVFNLAVVLKDAIWDNQTPENFEESFRSKAWATKNLDILTRKLCPTLRHFVVFSSVSCGRGNAGQTNYGMSNSVMERICERRAAEGLPGLAIQWGAVGDVGLVAEMQEDHKEIVIGGTLQQRITSCLKVLDGFLQQMRPVVSSIVVAEKKAGGAGALNIVDTVLNIMGLKDLKGVSPNTSLAELGMDSMMSVEIKQTLEREFGVFLTAQDIRGLNFAKLQEMVVVDETENADKVETTAEGETVTGLKLLVRIIGDKDINPETCLKMASRDEPGREEIFFIPGLEGVHSVFSTLAPKIKAPATCLQLGIDDTNGKSIFDMADHLLTNVLKKSKNRRHFTLTGYSYGTLVAIELMRRLEAEGFDGRLILIDGAPEYVKSIISQQFPCANKEELQNLVLLGIMNMVSPGSIPEFMVDIEKCKTWDEKLHALVARSNITALEMTDDHKKAMCTAVYNRILAAQEYDISQLPRIKASIILLKPTQPSLRAISEDYDLSKATSGNVEVYYVHGNHVTILENENVAAAINGESLEDAASFKKELMQQ